MILDDISETAATVMRKSLNYRYGLMPCSQVQHDH